MLCQGILYNLLPLQRHIIPRILLNIELAFLSVVSSLHLSPENEWNLFLGGPLTYGLISKEPLF